MKQTYLRLSLNIHYEPFGIFLATLSKLISVVRHLTMIKAEESLHGRKKKKKSASFIKRFPFQASGLVFAISTKISLPLIIWANRNTKVSRQDNKCFEEHWPFNQPRSTKQLTQLVFYRRGLQLQFIVIQT